MTTATVTIGLDSSSIERTLDNIASILKHEYTSIVVCPYDVSISISRLYPSALFLVEQTSLGVYSAFNYAIDFITSYTHPFSHILFVNAGDELCEGVNDSLITAQAHNNAIVSGYVNIHYQSGRAHSIYKGGLQFWNIPHPGTIYPIAVFASNSYDTSLRISGDWYFHYRIRNRFLFIRSSNTVARFYLGGVSSNTLSLLQLVKDDFYVLQSDPICFLSSLSPMCRLFINLKRFISLMIFGYFRRFCRLLYITLLSFGFDPVLFIYSCVSLPLYLKDLITFLFLSRKSRLISQRLHPKMLFSISPILSDRFINVGSTNSVYSLMNFWALSIVHSVSPKTVVDFGSDFYGYVIPLSAVVNQVYTLDVRPISPSINNISTFKADLSLPCHQQLPSATFISCLHVLEHVGLGRYNDRVSPYGYIHAISNIVKCCSKGATVILAVPVGSPRVLFNSHRIFLASAFCDICISNGLTLESFSFIDDSRRLVSDAKFSDTLNQHDATGLFHFTLA